MILFNAFILKNGIKYNIKCLTVKKKIIYVVSLIGIIIENEK